MIKKIKNICSHINYFMANHFDDVATDKMLFVCSIILACVFVVGIVFVHVRMLLL